MKVWFIWHDCKMHNLKWIHPPIDAFWVSATEEEAREYFVDKLSDSDKEEFEMAAADVDYMDGWFRGHRSSYGKPDNEFRFLVTRDLSRVDLGFAVYPYSGMWGSESYPFKKLEMKINDPTELMDIKYNETKT